MSAGGSASASTLLPSTGGIPRWQSDLRLDRRETVRVSKSPVREPQASVAESNKSRSRLQKHGRSYLASQNLPRSSDDMILFDLNRR